MNIYLSGAFNHREEIQQVAQWLTQAGYTVTSNWLAEPPLSYNDMDYALWERRARANDDVADVRRASVFVFFSLWPSTTGGRFVELGLALAWDKRIIRVGPPDNMFSHLAVVEPFNTLEDFKAAVAGGLLA